MQQRVKWVAHAFSVIEMSRILLAFDVIFLRALERAQLIKK